MIRMKPLLKEESAAFVKLPDSNASNVEAKINALAASFGGKVDPYHEGGDAYKLVFTSPKGLEKFMKQAPLRFRQSGADIELDEKLDAMDRAAKKEGLKPAGTPARPGKWVSSSKKSTKKKPVKEAARNLGTVTIKGKTFELAQAPRRGEMDMGEAGIQAEWMLKRAGKEVGKLVKWYKQANGVEYGLFLDAINKRIELKANEVKFSK